MFANAAAHLDPGGASSSRWAHRVCARWSLRPLDTHVGVDEYDAATQRIRRITSRCATASWERLSIPFRSVWPAELDLMGRLTGMELRERWADWDRSPFTAESAKHVSVWEKSSA